MSEKTTFNFVVEADQLERLRRRSKQEERSIGSLIREGLEYILTNRSYEQGIRDCCQWLRKSTIIDGKDLPDGRTFNEFLCDEMSSALKATDASEKEGSQEPS
jgi:hypothetical protein